MYLEFYKIRCWAIEAWESLWSKVNRADVASEGDFMSKIDMLLLAVYILNNLKNKKKTLKICIANTVKNEYKFHFFLDTSSGITNQTLIGYKLRHFWTRVPSAKRDIHYVYFKTGNFWLFGLISLVVFLKVKPLFYFLTLEFWRILERRYWDFQINNFWDFYVTT